MEIPKNVLNMLTEFTVCELGSKVLDGITYTLLLKNDKDIESIERYRTIKLEAARHGFADSRLFRIYELGNGYIFDMDISVAKMITAQLVKSINTEQKISNNTDLIRNSPELRRKRDLIALSKYIIKQFNNDKREIEVALFSRNSTNKIIINATGPNNETFAVSYNAYAIRHWDIELLNEKLLIPQGLRVSRLQPCEILPSKTGVSFLLTLERM